MFKRRFLATILLIALITSTFPCTYAIQSGFDNFTPQNTYSADTFRDISDSDWFARSVAAVYELGLMRGKGERRFDPNADVTIAEAITVAATLHSIYTTGSPGNFTAAAGEAWYVPYANYAHEHGIIDYHGGTMIIESHDNGVWMTDITHRGTRAIFAGILGKALPEEALSPINDIPNEAVPDFSLSSQYGPQVYALYRAGILTGSNEYGTFNPGSSIKRREVAAILSRMADPSLRVSFTPKSPDYVVTGTCGSNYTWEIIEGAFIASGGDNVTYSLDLGTGKMVISGNPRR